MQPIFITGIGTGIGKTVIAAIVAEALQAGYWKPVQAGYADGTDSEWIYQSLTNPQRKVQPETYKLRMAASPHIAAREEGIEINLGNIVKQFESIQGAGHDRIMTSSVPLVRSKEAKQNPNAGTANGHRSSANDFLVIEGAGGLLVPLNDGEFVIDLIKKLHAKVILVSRNYLGSINHSLLTAAICKQNSLDVLGWIFNDQYLHYEEEIVQWSGFPKIAGIPFSQNPGKTFISEQAEAVRAALLRELTVDG